MNKNKLGYIGVGFVALILILSILKYNGVTFLPTRFSSGTFSYSILLIAAGFWLLINEEHKTYAYVDFITSGIYTLIMLVTLFVESTDYYRLLKGLSYLENAVSLILLINIPLLIRTQSSIHKVFKWITILAMVLYIGTSISVSSYDSDINNYQNYDYDKYKFKRTLSHYCYLIMESMLICNPMIAFATAEGLSRGSSSSENIPTIIGGKIVSNPNMPYPSMMDNSTPVNTGVVPNNTNIQQVPPVNNTSVEQVPVESLDTSVVQNDPVQAMNSSDVAPGLQFLLDDNQENK